MVEGTPEINKALFEEVKRPQPCSWNECSQGHRWPPTFTVASCQGCGSSIVAFKQENCPFCNEPIVQTSVRSDFVPRGSGVSKRCLGQTPAGESIDIYLERNTWKAAQDGHKGFLEKQADEEAKQLSKGVQPASKPV